MSEVEVRAAQASLPPKRQPTVPRPFLFWFAVLFAVTQVPLWLVAYPDIDDYPAHVTRLQVLVELGTSETLRSFYVETPGVAPNMALDGLGVPMGKALGFEAGVKLFASIATLLLTTGTVALGFALGGRITNLALGSLLFSFNAALTWGILNFLLGTALAMWLLAAWILWRKSRSISVPQLGVFSLAVTLLYLCHLGAMGFFLLAVFAWECRTVSIGALIKAGTAACALGLPALGLHVFAYDQEAMRYAQHPDVPVWVVILYKTFVLPLMVPTAAFGTNAIVMALCVAGIYLGLRWCHMRGLVGFSSGGRRIGIAIGIAMLLLPSTGFGGEVVDVRLGLPLALVLWASVLYRGDVDGRTAAVLLPSVIAAGVATISAATLIDWHRAGSLQADLRQAMLKIEPGSKVAGVRLVETRPPFTSHSVCWSAVDRSAFVSSMYARPFNPFRLGYREDFVALAGFARLHGGATPPPREALLGRYDYAVVFGPDAATSEYAAAAETLYSTDAVRLIRLP